MSTPRQHSSSASPSSAKRNGKVAASPAVPPQTPAPLPATDDRDGWRARWVTQGQPWRTEPEIDQKRQAKLEQCRAIVPEIEKGMYPFKDVRLSQADVEWLLATHENERGPVDWNDPKSLHERKGIDLRGADLHHINLDGLLLTRMRGGLEQDERDRATAEQREMAAIHLEGASLIRTHLERADLSWAHMERANLFRVHLEGAYLEGCRLNDEQGIGPRLLNVRWGNADLAGVRWADVKMLADEDEARQKRRHGARKNRDIHLEELERAVRANRQLAVMLQAQGLNEDAARFIYRAQVLQRTILLLQVLRSGMGFRQWIQTLRSGSFPGFSFSLRAMDTNQAEAFLRIFW